MSEEFLSNVSKVILEGYHEQQILTYPQIIEKLKEIYPESSGKELTELLKQNIDELVSVIEANRLIN